MNSFDINNHIDMIDSQFGSFYRGFHYFERMMKEWREVFSLSNQEIRKPMVAKVHTPNGEELITETYQQELVFDQERVFIFEWDIVLAYYDLKQREQKEKEIELLPYLPFIDVSQLSFDKEELRQPYLPIILLNAHQVLQTHIVLNGNHRMVEAYQNHQSYVKGYYVQDLSHVKWMTSDFMQAMYEFMLDMRVVDHVLTNQKSQIDHEKLYHQLVISRLYPKITTNK